MDQLTTFGYEHEDGKIHYIITHHMTIDESQKYLILRKTPSHNNKIYIVNSVNDYFDNNIYTKDNSSLRIVYMLDGTIRCRRWNYSGEFLFDTNI
jgi:hypothetical protein